MKTILVGLLLISKLAGAAPVLEPLPDRPPIPKDNPQTEAKIHLGRRLYFDEKISVTETFACATCHDRTSGENNLPNSLKPNGKYSRHSVPTVLNAAFQSSYFWDGSAASLEEQAEGPLEEMGMGDTANVVKKIAASPDYRKEFQTVFPEDSIPVTLKNLTRALAAYERTLLTPGSAFDRYAAGDEKALSDEAREGLALFKSTGCIDCHNGPNFASPTLQPFPVYPDATLEAAYHFNEGKNVWRVPTLRNIALTAPYFHNGSVTTLEAAVPIMAQMQLNKRLRNDETRKIGVTD